MPNFIAYIDEAGDEGFGKLKVDGIPGGQSRWLAIGGCIVSQADNLRLPALKAKIQSRFPLRAPRDLHFRNLNHDQKVVACQEISAFPLGVAVMLSHKVTLPGSRYATTFKKKGYLYNYLVRWFLERVTAHCAAIADGDPCSLRLVFSRRGGTDYHSMKEYLCLMRDGREFMPPVRSIKWDVLCVDDIVVEDHAHWAGLQIADCVTSAVWTSVEPNAYGNTEPRYAELLRPRLLNRDGNALNVGLTPVPSLTATKAPDEQKTFLTSFSKGCG